MLTKPRGLVKQPLQQFEFSIEEKQYNFGGNRPQRSQDMSANMDNSNYLAPKDNTSRNVSNRQSRGIVNDNQFGGEGNFNSELDDQRYRNSINQGKYDNMVEDDDDDDEPPGLEDAGELSPPSKFNQANSLAINTSADSQKSSMNMISDTLKMMQNKSNDNTKSKDVNGNPHKNMAQVQTKLQTVTVLNQGKQKQKPSEEIDRKEDMNVSSKSGMNSKNSAVRENETVMANKVELISETKTTSNLKTDEEDKQNQSDSNIKDKKDPENSKSYDEVNQYMQKINETIRVSNKKLDSIPSLQQNQRKIEGQIVEFENDLESQRQAIRELEKSEKSKGQQESDKIKKYKNILKYLDGMIESKKETIKYIKDNIQLILDSNWQTKICQKMGNTLIQFHSIIMDDLNKLKYYNKTLPSKEEMELKDQVEKLRYQLSQEQENRKSVEEELEKRIVDFQNLFNDAQEAKLIIRAQLEQIMHKNNELKKAQDEFEKKKDKANKQNQAQQPKEPPPDKQFDNESKRSDRTATTSHNQIQYMYKQRVQQMRHQNQRDDDMHMSQNSSDHKDSKRKGAMDNKFYSEEEEDQDQFSYLESYDHMQQPEYRYEQQQFLNNNQQHQSKLDQQLQQQQPYQQQQNQIQQQQQQQGQQQLQQQQQQLLQQQQQQQGQQQPTSQTLIQNEGKINKLQSPRQNGIQISPRTQQPLSNIQNQQSPNIKMVVNKGVGKSALKKKLSDHITDDELKSTQQFSIGLFDFNFAVDEQSLNQSSYNRGYQNNTRSNSNQKKIFNTTTNSYYQNSFAPTNSFGVSAIYNYNQETGQNNSNNNSNNNTNTLRQMIQSIQTEKQSIRDEMLGYSILNN